MKLRFLEKKHNYWYFKVRTLTVIQYILLFMCTGNEIYSYFLREWNALLNTKIIFYTMYNKECFPFYVSTRFVKYLGVFTSTIK